MIEVLSPAGGLNNFYAALNAGADAVYLGLKDFSARANAVNFSLEELAEAVNYARLFNVKVYVTVNTLLKDEELIKAEEKIVQAHNLGVDAFIVQDFFFGKALKEKYPALTMHLSTQAGVCNTFYAKMAKEAGYSRVVLARELPLAQIAAISKIIETEVFVQGAMCTSFSGHCYFSSFVGANSGNRGRCKQPCRKKYSFHGKNFHIEPCYAISLADLSVGEEIHKLVEAGVTSFKIEGRMRREEYTSSATKYVKTLLEGSGADRSEISRIYNRGDYTSGYFFGQDKNLISSNIQNHKGVKIGTIAELRGKKLFVRSRHNPENGDGFKIVRDGKEVGGAVYHKEEIKPFGFCVSGNGNITVGDEVYITTDVALCREVLSQKRYLPVEIIASVTAEGATATFTAENVSVTVESKDVFPAQNAPLTKADFTEQMKKTAGLPVLLTKCRGKVAEGLFMTKSAVNALRREGYDKLFTAIRNQKPIAKIEFVPQPIQEGKQREVSSSKPRFAVISDTFTFNLIPFEKLIFAPKNYHDKAEIDAFFVQTQAFTGEKYLYLPPYFTDQDAETIYPYVKRFDGLFSEGLYGAELGKRLKKAVFFGAETNLFNLPSVQATKAFGLGDITLSKELSEEEIKAIGEKEAFVSTLGTIKLMQLCYCPFGKNCKTCKAEDVFIMKDEEGREFPVRRYRLNGCRFEVFNNAKQLPKEYCANNLVSFLGMTEEEKDFTANNLTRISALRTAWKRTTGGHLMRGVE